MSKIPSNLPLLYGLVGKIAINWACVEMGLDQCVWSIYAGAGGHTIADEIPKTAMRKKLEFVRECMRKLPVLAEYSEDGLKVFDRLSELAVKRHQTIHKAIFGVGEEDATYLAVGWEFKSQQPRMLHHSVTLENLHQVGEEMYDFSLELARFASRLAQKFGR